MFWEFTQWLSLFQLVWSITSFGYRKGMAIYGGWTRQTTINLTMSTFVILVILSPFVLTFGLWLPPILRHFS